jgi:hypothetical protein
MLFFSRRVGLTEDIFAYDKVIVTSQQPDFEERARVSDNNPETNSQQVNSTPPKLQKPVVPWPKWKTVVLIVFALVAAGLTINSSIQYESAHKGTAVAQKPPPTYTGEAPLSILTSQEALNSNNEFIIVVTPCSDSALNTSVTGIAVQAANKIRLIDKIYVGVFTLPANGSLNYPTVMIKEFWTVEKFQITLHSDVTLDAIYNNYLNWKFLRAAE